MSSCNQQLDYLLESLHIFNLDEPVTMRAKQSFPTIVKTLDALHLSTALLWRQETESKINVLSHDIQMLTAARALGLGIII